MAVRASPPMRHHASLAAGRIGTDFWLQGLAEKISIKSKGGREICSGEYVTWEVVPLCFLPVFLTLAL